jgi:hypothetical protein
LSSGHFVGLPFYQLPKIYLDFCKKLAKCGVLVDKRVIEKTVVDQMECNKLAVDKMVLDPRAIDEMT